MPTSSITIPITFEKGILESQETSLVPNGFTTVCQNLVPEPTGGLRTRAKWFKGSTTSAPATRKNVGIGYFSRLLTPGIVQASAVASVTTEDTTVTVDAEWPAPTTAGNLLLAVVGYGGAVLSESSTTTVITGYTLASASTATNNQPRTGIFYKANADSEEGAVTVTVDNATQLVNGLVVQLFEISGILAASPVDQTAGTQSSGTNPASGTTAATSQAIEFVIAALGDERMEAQTAPTNGFQQYSETQLNCVSDDLTLGIYYRTTTATGAQSTSVTTATSDQYAGAIATFKGWWAGTPASGQTSVTEFLVASNDTTQYAILSLDRDTIASATWGSESTITVSDPTQLVSFAPGFGKVWFTTPGFIQGYSYSGDAGTSVAAVTGMPPGRCVAVHKNRVFVGGSNAYPGRLYFSGLSNPTEWGITTVTADDPGYIDVDAQTGEPIEDIAPFEDGLLIGTRNSLYFLTGDGPASFRSVRLNGGGCAPGRTILPTPWGAVISGRDEVFLWAGGGVEPISRPIESSYGLSGLWMTSSYVDSVAYVCDQGSGKVFAFDLAAGSWHTETLPAGQTPATIYQHSGLQVYGPSSSAVASLLNYREFPAPTRGKDFDTLTEAFRFRTAEIWPVGPDAKGTPRRLKFQLRQRGGDATNAVITVTPYYDGTAQTARTITPHASASTFRAYIDLGTKVACSSVMFDITQTLLSTQGAAFDYEDVTLDFDIEGPRV